MKHVLAFALFLISPLLYSQTAELKLASDVWPPFTDQIGNHSFALNLVHEALFRTNVDAYTDILTFKDVLRGIGDETFDGSAALWRSPDREKHLLFSDPYLENRLILVGKKGSDVSATTLSDLNGKRIAVVESYAYGALLDEGRDIELVMGVSDQQNLDRLLEGETDYMLADALLIQYLVQYQSQEASEHLEIGTATLLTLPLHFAIRKNIPGAEEIIVSFNAEIKKMIADGSYNRILQLDWIANDVDGDGYHELVLHGDKAGETAPQYSYSIMTPQNGTADPPSRYLIEGNLYSDWDRVPDRYKVSNVVTTDAGTHGFGPVFKF